MPPDSIRLVLSPRLRAFLSDDDARALPPATDRPTSAPRLASSRLQALEQGEAYQRRRTTEPLKRRSWTAKGREECIRPWCRDGGGRACRRGASRAKGHVVDARNCTRRRENVSQEGQLSDLISPRKRTSMAEVEESRVEKLSRSRRR